jgi:hypothetical protein
MKKLLAILMVTLLVVGISTVGVAAARNLNVAVNEATGEGTAAAFTLTATGDVKVNKKDINILRYKKVLTLTASDAATFVVEGAKDKKDKDIVTYAVDEANEVLTVTSVKRFFSKTAKDIKVTATQGAPEAPVTEAEAATATYTFTVKPTFGDYLLIVLLFGWIWY